MPAEVEKNRTVPPRYRAAHRHLPTRLWSMIALVVGVFGLLFCLLCALGWAL